MGGGGERLIGREGLDGRDGREVKRSEGEDRGGEEQKVKRRGREQIALPMHRCAYTQIGRWSAVQSPGGDGGKGEERG